MPSKVIQLLATFFYIGKSPFAPGTVASFTGALLWIIFYSLPLLYVLLGIGVTLLGFLISGPMEDIMNEKDPSCVVIDEVAGVMIAFFLLPLQWPVLLTAFFLFRVFDMFKLYPVNKAEEIGGGVGIMMDDIVAGCYTFLTMQIAIRLAGII